MAFVVPDSAVLRARTYDVHVSVSLHPLSFEIDQNPLTNHYNLLLVTCGETSTQIPLKSR